MQLYLPRDSFSDISAALDVATGSALAAPAGRMLAEFMVLLKRNLGDLTPDDAARLPDAIQAMVALCLAPSADQAAKAAKQIDVTLMERVRRAVRKNLYSPSLGPDKLCREAAMSRSKLYRVLESEGGVAQYIQRHRLMEGFRMLCDVSSNQAIGKVAEMLCFADASSFSRVFRREFGLSPGDVRAAALAGLAPVASPSERPKPRPAASAIAFASSGGGLKASLALGGRTTPQGGPSMARNNSRKPNWPGCRYGSVILAKTKDLIAIATAVLVRFS